MATPDILTKSSIQELKKEINEEFERRCHFGSVSSLASWETDNSGKKVPKLTGID